MFFREINTSFVSTCGMYVAFMLGNRLAVLPIKVIGILFCNNKWQKSIKKYEYSKKVIDMTVIYILRDSLRSGDIFVRDSKKYN